jgi:glyoxylase-like metal-dependent hydrolase (beta-lactamase superfamily II)
MQDVMPLEDNLKYILLKAKKGLGYSNKKLIDYSGLCSQVINDLFDGRYNTDYEESLKTLAFCLKLNANALVNIAKGYYQPTIASLPKGLHQVTTSFGKEMTVNAYIIADIQNKLAITFDTGTDCSELLRYAQKHDLTIVKSFVTHTHLDHLADIDRLMQEAQSRGYGPSIENPLGLSPISDGDQMVIGQLKISVLGTHGHTPGGLSYYVAGLETPVVITGDALFAGSVGGIPPTFYNTGLEHIKQKILTLPNETIICPGHGPMSTVGQELVSNAFFQ